MDVGNGVVEYMRRIDSLTVECVHRDKQGEDSPYDMCQVNIGIFIFICTVLFRIYLYLSPVRSRNCITDLATFLINSDFELFLATFLIALPPPLLAEMSKIH